MMNRRNFLQNSFLSPVATRLISGSGLMPLLSQIAHARTATPVDPSQAKYFVMIRMTGGWDITLGLEPKQHSANSDQNDMFIEYTSDKILDAKGVKLGPAASPLLPYAGEFSVVNGIITATSDNGHDANLEYLSSGNGEGKAPYLPVEIAMASQSGSLGMVFSGRAKGGDRPVMVSSTSNVQSLVNSLNLAEFADYLGASTAQSDIYRAQQALLKDANRMDDLINRLRLLPSSGGGVSTSELDTLTLAATFLSGTAFQGQIDLSLNLDSHSQHEKQHLDEQTKGWNQVAKIFDIFKKAPVGGGASLFDRTLFVVISEFSRTPALNSAKGKDHNPLTNSLLLAGGLAKGGKVVGESHLITRSRSTTGTSIHAALPIDFTSGKIAHTKSEAQSGAFKYITPEPVVATIGDLMGVDWAKFKSVDPKTARLPL